MSFMDPDYREALDKQAEQKAALHAPIAPGEAPLPTGLRFEVQGGLKS